MSEIQEQTDSDILREFIASTVASLEIAQKAIVTYAKTTKNTTPGLRNHGLTLTIGYDLPEEVSPKYSYLIRDKKLFTARDKLSDIINKNPLNQEAINDFIDKNKINQILEIMQQTCTVIDAAKEYYREQNIQGTESSKPGSANVIGLQKISKILRYNTRAMQSRNIMEFIDQNQEIDLAKLNITQKLVTQVTPKITNPNIDGRITFSGINPDLELCKTQDIKFLYNLGNNREMLNQISSVLDQYPNSNIIFSPQARSDSGNYKPTIMVKFSSFDLTKTDALNIIRKISKLFTENEYSLSLNTLPGKDFTSYYAKFGKKSELEIIDENAQDPEGPIANILLNKELRNDLEYILGV